MSGAFDEQLACFDDQDLEGLGVGDHDRNIGELIAELLDDTRRSTGEPLTAGIADRLIDGQLYGPGNLLPWDPPPVEVIQLVGNVAKYRLLGMIV